MPRQKQDECPHRKANGDEKAKTDDLRAGEGILGGRPRSSFLGQGAFFSPLGEMRAQEAAPRAGFRRAPHNFS